MTTIVLVVEGATEKALKEKIKLFLDERAENQKKPRIRLQARNFKSLNPTDLRYQAEDALEKGAAAVVALIDVYPRFRNAAEAKDWLRQATGNPSGFYAHAAQFDVEAWLLPYWDAICGRIGVKQSSPGANPEQVDNQNPPSKRLKTLYQRAKPKPKRYVKQIEMAAILRDKDLTLAAAQCPELKAFLNTLLTLSNLSPLK